VLVVDHKKLAAHYTRQSKFEFRVCNTYCERVLAITVSTTTMLLEVLPSLDAKEEELGSSASSGLIKDGIKDGMLVSPPVC